MIIKSFSDIETYLKYLNPEESTKALAKISFVIVKNLSEQNNVDMTTVLKKFVSLISEDNTNKLLQEIDSAIFKNINNDDSVSKNKTEAFESSSNINITGFQGKVANLNLNKPIRPLPPTNTNVINNESSFKEVRENQKLENNRFLNIDKGIKFIIPVLTVKGNKALVDLSTSMDVYTILKQISGKDSIEQVYININASDNNINSLNDSKRNIQGHFLINFVEKIVKLYREGYISCIKGNNIPSDKILRMRLGDLMVYMGLISQEKLEKSIEFQRTGRIIGSVDSNFALYNSQNKTTRLLIGDLLLSSNLINKTQLEKALFIQRWYNNII